MFEREKLAATVAEEGARGGGVVKAATEREAAAEEEAAAAPVHSQVRRIKQEEEEGRELLLRLQLLEMRPATGFHRDPAARQASPSPLRRGGGGQAISVGD